MKQNPVTLTVVSILCSVFMLLCPLGAVAEEPDISPAGDDQAAVSSVMITEVQTGAQTASDEFIELYNTGSQEVDITGWQIRYANSSVVDGSSTLLVTISSPNDSQVLLPGHSYYLLHSASVTAPSGVLAQTYPAGISKTDKVLALFKKDEATCRFVVQDAVAWETVPGTTKGEGTSIAVSATTSSKDKLLQRYGDQGGVYVDTDSNNIDFVLSVDPTEATPGSYNARSAVPETTPGVGSPSVLAAIEIPGCTIPDPETPPEDEPPDTSLPPTDEPPAEDPQDAEEDVDVPPVVSAANPGLQPPQISELLPNPASPQTDANDEFIELYNPNDSEFDLSGYVLEAGLTTKHRYIIPEGAVIAPRAFLSFFAADTKLSLSNSGGQVALLSSLNERLVASEPYGVAKEGESWLLANGIWQWSVTPTPNATNSVISLASVKKANTTKPVAKKSTKKATVSSKTPKPKAKSPSQDVRQATAVASTTATPLHPGVLALIAVSALLYGAYEYRRDVANKIYQFRSNRAARRELRQSAKGR